ncbi:MAG TPA: efflux RND transporter periplasmic adaptor subunit, partial [Candidatus Polarisedimenticolia bacterium]|nr:efflux RND transporter periplasmic adaptor subunit [Candidatus Polarisedimenticolia bacterium]
LPAGGCADRRPPDTIVVSGHVEATEVRIAAEVPGRLVSFEAAEGDRVERGQTIARIDSTEIELALRQARAEADQADAELRLALAGARAEEIAEAEAQVRSAAADLAGAESDLRRMEELLERGSGTEKSRDDARTRRDVARSRWEALRHEAARLKAGSRPQEIERARARAEAAQARVEQIEEQLRDASVLSPVTGLITEKMAEQGELVSAGSRLAVVSDLGDPWLTVYLGEADLGRVRIGQEAEVATDGGQVRRGRVTFIASQAEFTPRNVQTRDERVKLVYRTKIALPNEDGVFKPGMPAEARLRTAAEGP